MRHLVTQAQRAQHVAGLQAGRGAGRAGGHRHALDAHEQRFALDELEADVEVVRHALRHIAVDQDLGDDREALQQAVAQRTDAFVLAGHVQLGQAVGLTHAGDLVRGQGARAHASLVPATVHLRLDAHARLAAHVQRAYALGPVGLVGREAEQVDGLRAHVERGLAAGLGRVHMEEDALAAAQRADGVDVLHHADLVVHGHHRDQDGVGPDGGLQHFKVDEAVGQHIQVGHFKAHALQLTHGVEHGLVLGLDGDEVLALALVELRRALDGEVVRFGGTRGPGDLARVGTDQRGHVFAGNLHRFLRSPAKGMAARSRVAKLLIQVGHHHLHHPWVHRRGGGVVQVDRLGGVHRVLQRLVCPGGRCRLNRNRRASLASNRAYSLSR